VGKPQSEAVPHLGCFLRLCSAGRLAQTQRCIPCSLQLAAENGLGEGSSLLNAPLHTSMPSYLPFGFQYAAQARAKIKHKFHLKLLGIRQSSNFLDTERHSHKALIRTGISPMLFLTPKSTRKLHPAQAVGPKDYKAQKNHPKQKGLDN